MLLTIDSGNTNCVFAVYDGREQRALWRASTDVKRTADEYAVWLTQLMALKDLKPADITATIIANVVPAVSFALRSLCRRYFPGEVLVVGEPGTDLGIKTLIDRPEEAGPDRLVNAVAALEKYSVPAIVIDFGTATTFDVIDAEGNYRGGVIAPGIHASMEALHLAAARLPRVEVRRPGRVIGTATIPAMQSGVFWGYIGLIEGLVSRIKREYGAEMSVIGTGGLAPLFAESTDAIQHIDGDLTLDGLVRIYERNRRGAG